MNQRARLLGFMHPALQLLLLTMLSFVFLMAFFFLGMYLTRPLFGITGIDLVAQHAIANPDQVAQHANQVDALKFLQFTQTLGAFLIPAILFAFLKFPGGDYLRLKSRTNISLIIIAIALLLACTPLIQWLYSINQQMELPAAFSGLEKTMSDMEHSDDQLTSLFLKAPHAADLWINLLVIAVLPAIAEEFCFRGCVQQVLKEWTRNSHAAVWGAAFIFSFIHFQFYGFIPRLVLGALLGYLFLWSGSLWVPIFAHAFNNGAQVVLAYLHEHGSIAFDVTSDQEIPLLITIVATVVFAGLLWLFYRISVARRFIY